MLGTQDDHDAAIAAQLSHHSDSSAVSHLGGDKRFDLDRYTCSSFDPFGGVVQA